MSIPEPDATQRLQLLKNWSCPFSQRVVIALHEKQVPHDVVELDLDNKPAWMYKYSTYGLTPAFIVPDKDGPRGVFHNLFCNEYLEDEYPELVRLLPTHPVDKAAARVLIDAVANKIIPSLHRAQFEQDAEERGPLFEAVSAELSWLDKTIRGPYFLGEQFSLVDCALLPWLMRMDAYCAVTGYTQPEGLGNLQQYLQRCLERPAVAASCTCRPGSGEQGYAAFQAQMLEVYQSPEFAAHFTPSTMRPRKK